MAHSSHNNEIHCFTGNPQTLLCQLFKFYFCQLPLYNQVILVARGLHVFGLCLQTVEYQSFPVLISYTQLALPWKQKGRACATFVSWQDISIEIHVCAVWKMLKQWSTQRKCRESSEKTKPAQLSTWCSHLELLEIWVSRNTILLVWTTRDWKEQLDHKYQKINMRHWLQRYMHILEEKKELSRDHYYKNCCAVGNWHAQLPEKQ